MTILVHLYLSEGYQVISLGENFMNNFIMHLRNQNNQFTRGGELEPSKYEGDVIRNSLRWKKNLLQTVWETAWLASNLFSVMARKRWLMKAVVLTVRSRPCVSHPCLTFAKEYTKGHPLSLSSMRFFFLMKSVAHCSVS